MNRRIVHKVFEAQVEKFPAGIAIEEEGRTITYLELNDKANGLSHRLLNMHVQKGAVVAVVLPAGIELVSALLAIFKAGAIYLPVDARFPATRLRQMFSQCRPVALITTPALLSQLPQEEWGLDATEIIFPEMHRGTPATEDSHIANPGVDIQPGDNNYIFYTSGSTGEGKAILGIHDSLSHFIQWEIREFSVGQNFRISQLTQYTFDASLRDIFVALCTGGTLCIPSPETKDNIAQLTRWLQQTRITLMHCVPSLFRLITRELKESAGHPSPYPDMRHILIAGEILFAKDIHSWRSAVGDGVELVNLYGPTETTLVKTFHRIREVSPDPGHIVHVGKPISNTAIAIINDGLLCSPGEIGDVYIRTPFITAGYYKNEALTKTVFIQNPLVTDRKDIVYKTGDRGRYLPDQNIEILNRLDDQVKINGIRVELSEIHHAVLVMDGVEQAVVMARRNEEWQSELVCYYSGKDIPPAMMRQHLSLMLVPHTIPSYFIHLDTFPINSNGKIDKQKLPEPQQAVQDLVRPDDGKTGPEQEVEKIWREVLGMDQEINKNVSFFQLGGNSLKAILLISRVFKRFGVKITIKDIYAHSTIGTLSRLLFPGDKPEDADAGSGPVKLRPVPQQEYHDLSHSQKRLWILDRMENAGSVYNITGAWLLEGTLDINILQLTMSALTERHEILRTIFPIVEGQPKQKILASDGRPFLIEYEDLSSHPDQERRIDEMMQRAVNHRFDLKTGPLLGMQCIQLGPQRQLAILTMHHIISDGWSMHVLFREIVRIYKMLLRDRTAVLPRLPVQYKDYCYWLKDQLTGEKLRQHGDYWLGQFSGPLPVPDLPADYRRPSRKSFRGQSCTLVLDQLLKERISRHCEEKGVSLFMWLTTVVYVLLCRYTDQQDIVIGTVVAGREHADLEDQIGFYVNTLPLRIKMGGHESFDALLQKVKTIALDAFVHQLYPFDLLLEQLDLARDLSQSPLFEVMIVLQNIDLGGEGIQEIEGLTISPFPYRNELSKFDLVFNFNEQEEGLRLKLDYNQDLFSADRMRRLVTHFENLTGIFLDNSAALPGKVNFLHPDETADILYTFNDTAKPYPDATAVIALFEQQVERTPGNMAVFYKNKGTTYTALNRYANQLAHLLVANYPVTGENPVESPIAVMLDRSDLLLIAMLGALKSGRAYLPIDKHYPPGKIRQILEDSRSGILITDEAGMKESIPGDVDIICMQDTDILAGYPGSNSPFPADGGHLAYIIYTSGSTGKPKGVMVEHRALINLCYWHIAAFGLNEKSRATLYAGIGFDASVWETWPYLLSGGCLFPLREPERLDISRLIDFLNVQGITHAFLPTLICEQVQEHPDLRLPADLTILTGGDRLRKNITGKDLHIVNNYGPTEAAVVSTSISLQYEDPDTIPIGRPIDNVQILILDSQQNMLPVGLPGEIFIAGDNLARGYWHQPELTAEKFIPNPFPSIKGSRLYATGDQACWLEDGNIKFLGRKDQQVKIRGYRIELREIENAMMRHPSIENAIVLPIETMAPYLCAYYTGKEDLTAADIKKHLSHYLPFYMLPARFIRQVDFPMTPNGKIDRDELLKLNPIENTDDPKGRDALEKQLIDIWKEVLGRQHIGATDNFFEMGGHSLKAMQVLSRIYRHIGVNLDLAETFIHQTVREQAALIRTMPSVPFLDIQPSEEQEYYPLSNSQKRLWLIEMGQENMTAYNVCAAYIFGGILNRSAITAALGEVIARYEILRTVFRVIEGEPRQKIYTPGEWRDRFEYLEYHDARGSETLVKTLTDGILSASFDIENGPLFRCIFIRKEENEGVFLLNVHHLILDGWSLGILIDEIITTYNYYCRHEKTMPLPAPAIQYKDYVRWNENNLQSASSPAQQYWLSRFREPVTPLKLARDFERRGKATYKGKNIGFSVDEEDTILIRGILKNTGTTLFMFMLAALKAFLFRWSGQQDIVVGTPSAGRRHKSLEGMPGLFVNTLALRTHVDPQNSFLSLLTQVKDTALNAFKYEYYPFDRLVEELDADKHHNNPLFDVFITLQNAGKEAGDDIQGLTVQPLALEISTSQFALSIDCWERADCIIGKFNYAEDLFWESTANKMLAGYLKLIKRVASHPADNIGDISISDPLEESLIRTWASITSVPVSALKTDMPFSRDADTKLHARLLADHLKTSFGVKVTTSDIISHRNFSELVDYVRINQSKTSNYE